MPLPPFQRQPPRASSFAFRFFYALSTDISLPIDRRRHYRLPFLRFYRFRTTDASIDAVLRAAFRQPPLFLEAAIAARRRLAASSRRQPIPRYRR